MESDETTVLADIHRRCRRNREALGKGQEAGCFHCLAIFDPARIVAWCDHGETALCPRCAVDAILPQHPDYTLDHSLLGRLYQEFFSRYVEFVLCRANGDNLVAGRRYRFLPDADAAEQHLYRVLDESGESHLYPDHWFEPPTEWICSEAESES